MAIAPRGEREHPALCHQSPTDPVAVFCCCTRSRVREDDELEPGCTMHVHVGRQQWNPGIMDPLLRAIADDLCNGVIITDTALRRIYHPYDGGADVIMASTDERDHLKATHAEWLPRNRHGR